jgi:hypothetical protein
MLGGGTSQEIAELVAIEDAARRDVRHRIEPRRPDGGDRLERARERQAGERRYVHAASRGQERRHLARAM